MKRGVVLVGVLIVFITLASLNLVDAQTITNTYPVNISICRGGNLGSPNDCTSELNNSDNIKFTIAGIGKTTNQAYANGSWNISLSSSFTLIEVIGLFEWEPEDSATYALKWYFWNSTSSLYQAVNCPDSVQIGPLGDMISTCNLTTIYKNTASLQSVRLENEINASASKRVSIDYFAINVTYNPDITPPNLSITYPLSSTYQSVTELNYTVSPDALTCKYSLNSGVTNTTITCGNNVTALSAGSGSNTWIVYASDSNNNENKSLVTFTIDNTAPVMSLVFPEAKTYGYNTSLSLNFSVSDVSGLSSCWYNLDYGNNVTLANCQNTTFDTSDGIHTLYLYSNDTLNNIQESNVKFSVVTNAPAVNLISPGNNSFLNYSNNIYFNYSVVSGIGVSSCQLYGNFTGSWSLNQTNSSISLENNFFILNLTDNNYNWGIYCNDTQNRISNVNSSFVIDTINPGLTLNEPTGTKTTRTNIQAVWSISDLNVGSCEYNVYKGINLEIANTSISCILNLTTFNVTLDADFTFNFYVNDSAGNRNSSSLAFTVSTSSGGGGGDDSGGGGGGGSSSGVAAPSAGKLKISSLGDVVINPGESKTLSLKVRNVGSIFLNKCRLSGNLISSNDIKSLATGQEEDFVFVLNMPNDFSSKIVDVKIECDKASETTSFSISFPSNPIELKLISTKQEKGKLNFLYSVKQKQGKEQSIEIEFWLEDELGKVVEGRDSFVLKAGEETEKQGSLNLPGSGEYVFNLKYREIILKENILIGSTGLIGRVLLVVGGEKILGVVVFLVISIFLVIYVVRRIIRRPLKDERTGYVKIKLNKKI